MLKSVKLTRFRTHNSLELNDLPMLSVLVGRNNTGKSAILQAIGWAKYAPNFLPVRSAEEVSFRGQGSPTIEVEYSEDYAGTPSPGRKGSFVPQPGPVNSWSGNITPLRNSVFYLGVSRFAPRSYPYQPLSKDVGPSGQGTWPILRELRDSYDRKFEAVESWLRKLNLGLANLSTPSESTGTGTVAASTFGDRMNIALQGAGLGSVLPVIVQGLLCESGSLLLVEEPESHLHRAAIDGLWEFFGDCAIRGVQVLMTTHSLDLLASMNQRIEDKAIPPDSAVFHLKRSEDGITSVTRLDPKLFAKIRRALKEDLAGHDF